jgi:hypothetical protein
MSASADSLTNPEQLAREYVARQAVPKVDNFANLDDVAEVLCENGCGSVAYHLGPMLEAREEAAFLAGWEARRNAREAAV